MRSTQHRCRIVAAARHEIAQTADTLITETRSDQRTEDIETVASELIPLCDALGWIGRHGSGVLADRKVGLAGRPVWMWGVRSRVQRVAWGRVLVLGTWNYPIFLSGVQIAQALAAGNSVLLKPAPGCETISHHLLDAFHRAGVPEEALRLLDSSAEAAIEVIEEGVDLVVLTGAASTGRKVLLQTAEKLTPAIMELSGVDAVIVLPRADTDRVVAAIRFGLLFNSGATCIGPRRIFYCAGEDESEPSWCGELIDSLRDAASVIVHPAARSSVADAIESAIDRGAVDRVERFDGAELRRSGRMAPVVLSNVPRDHEILETDLFAPVMSLISVESERAAVDWVNGCRYRLAASVFGPPQDAARVAGQLSVGCVVVNDLVMPTADPRLPFGGRGESGFGVTRGPEGLLAMSTVRVIATRSGRWAPHLSPPNHGDDELLTGVLKMNHGCGWRERIGGLKRLTSAVRGRRGLKQATSDRPPPPSTDSAKHDRS